MVAKRAGRKARRAGRRRRKHRRPVETPGRGFKPVEVSKTNYKSVEGFCRICGAKIHGDNALINHVSEHDGGIAIGRYASMDEDARFNTIFKLAERFLTSTEPEWYKAYQPLNMESSHQCLEHASERVHQ